MNCFESVFPKRKQKGTVETLFTFFGENVSKKDDRFIVYRLSFQSQSLDPDLGEPGGENCVHPNV
jgi:hypothetical protein